MVMYMTQRLSCALVVQSFGAAICSSGEPHGEDGDGSVPASWLSAGDWVPSLGTRREGDTFPTLPPTRVPAQE